MVQILASNEKEIRLCSTARVCHKPTTGTRHLPLHLFQYFSLEKYRNSSQTLRINTYTQYFLLTMVNASNLWVIWVEKATSRPLRLAPSCRTWRHDFCPIYNFNINKYISISIHLHLGNWSYIKSNPVTMLFGRIQWKKLSAGAVRMFLQHEHRYLQKHEWKMNWISLNLHCLCLVNNFII